MKKQIISIIIVIILILMSTTCIFAEETPPMKSQLVLLAQEADMFADLLVYGTGRNQNHNPQAHDWAVEKGYLDDNALNGVNLNLDELFGIPNLTCYPYSASMDSLDTWKKEVQKYFISDIYALVTPQKQGLYSTTTVNYWLLAHEGYTYFSPFPTKQLIADWTDTELVSANSSHAVLSVHGRDVFEQGESTAVTYTVEFTNTENGWRISGGTYFLNAYGYSADYMPAETGDSAVYAAWLVGLALLALGAVVRRKKRI